MGQGTAETPTEVPLPALRRGPAPASSAPAPLQTPAMPPVPTTSRFGTGCPRDGGELLRPPPALEVSSQESQLPPGLRARKKLFQKSLHRASAASEGGKTQAGSTAVTASPSAFLSLPEPCQPSSGEDEDERGRDRHPASCPTASCPTASHQRPGMSQPSWPADGGRRLWRKSLFSGRAGERRAAEGGRGLRARPSGAPRHVPWLRSQAELSFPIRNDGVSFPFGSRRSRPAPHAALPAPPSSLLRVGCPRRDRPTGSRRSRRENPKENKKCNKAASSGHLWTNRVYKVCAVSCPAPVFLPVRETARAGRLVRP